MVTDWSLAISQRHFLALPACLQLHKRLCKSLLCATLTLQADSGLAEASSTAETA